MQYRGLLKSSAGSLDLLLRFMDMLVIVAAGVLSHKIYLNTAEMSVNYQLLIGLVLLVVTFVFPQFKIYRAWRGSSIFSEIRTITLAWLVVILILALYLFVNKIGAYYSRGWVITWVNLGWFGLLIVRIGLRRTLYWMRSHGYNIRRLVIVGEGEFAQVVIQRLHSAPWLGLQLQGIFTSQSVYHDHHKTHSPVLGSIADLASYLESHKVDQVWIALPLRDEQKVQTILNELRFSTVDIRYIPDIFALKLLNHSISDVEGLPVLDLSATPMTSANRIVKAIEDRVIAACILLLISPLMLAIAIGVKCTSEGPVFFRQRRLGWDGKTITVYKFRTMFIHKEADERVTQATRNDKRITNFGRFLRQTSLDELPQFINVLQGRMSIVGPRPHALPHNEQFKDVVQNYMRRHKVKPGITGWAQVNGWRGEVDSVEKIKKRVDYDLYYIENWSLWFDLKIILATILNGFVGKNAY